MKQNLFLVAVLAFLLVGCAATNISSVSDINSAKRSYSRILVLSTFQDLMYKQAVESAFRQKCIESRIRVRTGSEILPPVREYSQDEVSRTLADRNIDGLLVVALQGYWESHVYTPGYTKTTGAASIVGNTIVYSQKQQFNPGSIFSKPRINFESRFFDGETGKVVWRSTSLTAGNALADFSTLANSLASATIGKLIKDRIVKPSLAIGSTGSSGILTVPTNPADALKSAEGFYLKAEYQNSMVILSALKSNIERLAVKDIDSALLSKVYFLWGSCYIKAWNRTDLAGQYYQKVLEYASEFMPNSAMFDAEVIGEFEKYKKDVWTPQRVQQEQDLGNKNEIQSGEKGAKEAGLARILKRGDKIRVVKPGASLRVKPDSGSLTIRDMPLGALLEFEELSGEWIKIKLPPGSDGIVIVGYVHVSFVEPDR